jgi:DNA modification methylase
MKTNDQHITSDFAIYNDDCCERIKDIPSNSIGLSIYSPPFSQLYTYSASERDMGNCKSDEEFFAHYGFLIGELLRVTKPGRLCAVHCKDLVDYKNSSGRAGLRDFPGELIRAHEVAGWKYHSRATVWKCPVTEMQRTKAHGLLYKQLRADSTFSRMGLAEYVLYFRKWAEESDPIEPVTHTKEELTLDQWQNWASPVWMDIDQTDVLNVRIARDDQDEKHMCPLQLDLIERVVLMYSNPGDVVLSPFAGIGSEGVVSLQKGRKFIGIELKDAYYKIAVRNLSGACKQTSIFDRIVT